METKPQSESIRVRLFRNLVWGVREGFRYSMVYTGWGLSAFLTGGAVLLAKLRLGLLPVLMLYLCAPVVAGTVIAMLRPLCRTMLGQMFVGAVAGLPIGFAVYMVLLPVHRWGAVADSIRRGLWGHRWVITRSNLLDNR